MSRLAFGGGLLFAAAALIGCGGSGVRQEWFGQPEPVLPIPSRTTTVVAETCVLDSWQTSALAGPAARHFVREIIVVCPAMRSTGDVAPLDADARAALAQTVMSLRTMGYAVRLGVTMGDDSATFPRPYSDSRSAAAFADPTWRAAAIQNLAPFAAMADGIEIDLVGLPSAARQDVTHFFVELDAALGKAVSIGLMAPPQDPMDAPGGGSIDLAQIGPHIARLRVMTLDFSCCGAAPGPDIDPAWAVSAVRDAMSKATVPMDVAFPLYGTDFSDLGNRFVSYEEALATAIDANVVPVRDETSELHFDWIDRAGHAHHTWAEDGVAASRTLHAWDPGTLPLSVGVLLYGVGAEDPLLWDTIARGLP
jgi:hypothetical protein